MLYKILSPNWYKLITAIKLHATFNTHFLTFEKAKCAPAVVLFDEV